MAIFFLVRLVSVATNITSRRAIKYKHRTFVYLTGKLANQFRRWLYPPTNLIGILVKMIALIGIQCISIQVAKKRFLLLLVVARYLVRSYGWCSCHSWWILWFLTSIITLIVRKILNTRDAPETLTILCPKENSISSSRTVGGIEATIVCPTLLSLQKQYLCRRSRTKSTCSYSDVTVSAEFRGRVMSSVTLFDQRS